MEDLMTEIRKEMALNESRSKLRFDKEYSGLEQTFDCEIEPLKYRPRNFRKIDTLPKLDLDLIKQENYEYFTCLYNEMFPSVKYTEYTDLYDELPLSRHCTYSHTTCVPCVEVIVPHRIWSSNMPRCYSQDSKRYAYPRNSYSCKKDPVIDLSDDLEQSEDKFRYSAKPTRKFTRSVNKLDHKSDGKSVSFDLSDQSKEPKQEQVDLKKEKYEFKSRHERAEDKVLNKANDQFELIASLKAELCVLKEKYANSLESLKDAKEREAGMNDTLKQCKEGIIALNKKLEDNKSDCSMRALDYEKEIKDYSRNVQAITEELTNTKTEFNNLMNKHDLLKKQIEELNELKKDKDKGSENEIADLKKLLEEKNTELKNLTDELTEREDRIKRLESELNEARGHINRKDLELEKLTNDLYKASEFEKLFAKAQIDLENYQNKYKFTDQDIGDREKKITELENGLKEAKSSFDKQESDLNEGLAKKDDEINKLKADLDEAKDQMEKKDSEMVNLASDLSRALEFEKMYTTAKKDLENYQIKFKYTEEDMKEKEEKIQDLENELTELNNQMDKEVSQRDRLAKENEKLNEEILDLKAKIEVVEKDIEWLKNEKLKKETSLENEIEELKDTVEGLNKVEADLKTEISDLKSSLVQVNKDLGECKEEKRLTSESLEASNRNVLKLEEELEKQNDNLEKTVEDLRNEKEETSKLRGIIVQLTEQLSIIENQKMMSEEKVRDLENNLSEMNVKLQTCQSELNQCKEEMIDCKKTLEEKNERIAEVSLKLQSCEKQILYFKEQVRKLTVCHGELFYRISPSMNIKEISPKEYSCSSVDGSDKEGCSEVLLGRFKMVEDGGAFKAEFEQI